MDKVWVTIFVAYRPSPSLLPPGLNKRLYKFRKNFSVNMDLSSDVRVLPNAPLAGYDDDFSTLSMKTFDLVS